MTGGREKFTSDRWPTCCSQRESVLCLRRWVGTLSTQHVALVAGNYPRSPFPLFSAISEAEAHTVPSCVATELPERVQSSGFSWSFRVLPETRALWLLRWPLVLLLEGARAGRDSGASSYFP